jgi:glycosyltransferase involved in cell wall biosynthesis
MKKIMLITTVPETFETILNTQPKFLSSIHDVHIVSSQGIETSATKEGVNCSVVDMKRGISPFFDILSIWNLAKVILKEKPDIIHSFTPKAGLISAIAGYILLVPNRVHTFTGLIFPTQIGMRKLLLKFIDKVIIKLNTKIVCEGQGVWNELATANISDTKFKIIGNGNIAGVDLNYFSYDQLEEFKAKAPTELKLINHTKFLFVGRLNRDKGIKELVEAFEEVEDDSTLIILGSIDKTAPPSQCILNKIIRNKKIIHLGFLNDIRPILSLSDCIILASYREGFPNVILQAGAMGLPSIVSNVSGSNEIIKHDVNGWIVPVKNTRALESEMKKFISLDKNLLSKLKEQAIKNVHNKYERKYYQNQILEFYEEL